MGNQEEQKAIDNAGHRQRVRSRFLKDNGKNMADYELLELLLMMSIPRRDVKPIAKELLRKFGSFADVVYAPINELEKVGWVKESTCVLFKAIVAAVCKICRANLQDDVGITLLTPDALVDYCRATMAYEGVEELRVFYMNAACKLIDDEVLQRGSPTNVPITPRDVVSHAVEKKSASIILVHNHPSDNVKPSEADKILTCKICYMCTLMGIVLQDHIVIGRTDFYSFLANGLMQNIRMQVNDMIAKGEYN
ncbi:MAG: RadC family protein [Alphaproteobacteria bacterium]|nr:RadC family protein [Alphaproteobacteria bacterium]